MQACSRNPVLKQLCASLHVSYTTLWKAAKRVNKKLTIEYEDLRPALREAVKDQRVQFSTRALGLSTEQLHHILFADEATAELEIKRRKVICERGRRQPVANARYQNQALMKIKIHFTNVVCGKFGLVNCHINSATTIPGYSKEYKVSWLMIFQHT